MLVAAEKYANLTRKKNILAHVLADAFIANGDFDSAADLRDEMELACEELKRKCMKQRCFDFDCKGV